MGDFLRAVGKSSSTMEMPPNPLQHDSPKDLRGLVFRNDPSFERLYIYIYIYNCYVYIYIYTLFDYIIIYYILYVIISSGSGIVIIIIIIDIRFFLCDLATQPT